MKKYPPIVPSFSHFLYGGDYSPDQWPEDVWDEDMRLMKLAGCNAMTLPVFSWAQLEPSEGVYTFDWLDRIVDKLWANGVRVVMSTPSAAIPAWLAKQYPEVLRTRHDRVRKSHGFRVNFCLTSPVYRERTAAMAEQLATRYKDHPALSLWHVSNEYHSDCHCPLCQTAFREWLKRKYKTLDALNQAWWTAFWSHTYTDWEEIESPQPWPHGEWSILGLGMDWKRFATEQTLQCYLNEADVLRRIAPGVPVTTNMHALISAERVKRWAIFAEHVDVVSWDNYPCYDGTGGDVDKAVLAGFQHDAYRSLKAGQPFMMMESNPGAGPGQRQQRPGVLERTAVQAIAHGADTVQYFQWRNGRGCTEKFHGAVVEHVGHEHTRKFKEAAAVGANLKQLDCLIGTAVPAEAALIFDEENYWALEYATTARHDERDYINTCLRQYRPFWERGIPLDVIPMHASFDQYRVLIAPLLYCLRPGVAERIEAFVKNGGTLVTTYWSGYVDENDLAFTGGFPGPLRTVCGVWSEELDALLPEETNSVSLAAGNALGLAGTFAARRFCDVLHAEGAETLATFGGQFYAGSPALTRNAFGKGEAYYIGFLSQDGFLDSFYGALAERTGLRRALDAALPDGVTAQMRTDGETDYVFLTNFSAAARDVPLDAKEYRDLLSGESVAGTVTLSAYGTRMLARDA